MVGCWCLSKLWTKGTVKCSFDYIDTSVAVCYAADTCCQVTACKNSGVFIWFLGVYRKWRVIENSKWEEDTQQTRRDPPELIIRSTCCCCVHLIYLCCRAELNCSFQDNAVIPATPSSSMLESGLLVCTSEAGCLCPFWGLYWAQGTAHVHKSSGDLGIGASPELQRLRWEQIFKSLSLP